MKTLSVREVAGVLGLTKRAVMYRLENGKLKGTRVTNSFGQEEWRVYPNREIMQAVQAKAGTPEGEINFNPADVVDSVIVESLEEAEETKEFSQESRKPRDFDRLLELFREQFAPELVAEKMVKPLVDKIEAQQAIIFEQRQELSDKDRQLRLLPDLQKQAEQHVKERDLLHVETEALKKQIAALQDKQATLESELTRSSRSWISKLFKGNCKI